MLSDYYSKHHLELPAHFVPQKKGGGEEFVKKIGSRARIYFEVAQKTTVL